MYCLQIVNSQFNSNAATRGGAIDSSGATVSIINSAFSANHAHSTGGAVWLADASALTVLNTTFSANVAGALLNPGLYCALQNQSSLHECAAAAMQQQPCSQCS